MIAEVVLNNVSKATDNIYHYAVPTELASAVQIGMRVEIGFGKGNKASEGYIIGFVDKSEFDNLKPILRIVDNDVYFDADGAALAKFMHHRYFCSYAQAFRALLPVGVNIKFSRVVFLEDVSDEEIDRAVKNSAVALAIVNELKKSSPLTIERLAELTGKKNIYQSAKRLIEKGIVRIETVRSEGVKDTISVSVSLSCNRTEAYELCDMLSSKAKAQSRALEVLADCGTLSLSELTEYASVTKKTVDALISRGVAQYAQTVVRSDLLSDRALSEYTPHELTDEQQNAVDAVNDGISSKQYSTYLLRGVTGSGKTEVYLELIERTINGGRQAIMLVPEIALTPQMVSQVMSRFCGRAAVLHSSLTVKQRYDEWKKIKEGAVDVAVGARSAVFAPFDNLGLIIIDEEHENTYKSESAPRYHAAEIARFRAKSSGATVLLASATPSVESYYKAQTGKYKLIEMLSRIGNAELPEVLITDMREELKAGNMSIFSKTLASLMRRNIDEGRQTMLFLNRRGYSNAVSCRNCGYVVKCPHCNVSLTYHKFMNKMICHYCDYMTDVPHICPSCGGKYIRYFGTGTQKVTETIEQMFPDATYLRMDADTTSDKNAHEKILNKFRSEKTDILVGTQMITKGLDFENVTLVGVLAADMSLNQEDYRASERTFDLITQVAGRAGRGRYPGTAVIQTYSPNDDTIILSAKQDYEGFYKNEIEFRAMLSYPPFCEFVNILFTSADEDTTKSSAERFYTALTEKITEKKLDSCAQVFEPCKAPIYMINDKYRYRILAKTRYNKELYDILGSLYENFCRKSKEAAVVIDVNPQSLY